MKKILTAITLLLSSINTVSADTFCHGQVKDLSIGRGGTVYVSGPGDMPVVYLCRVNQKYNGVEAEACKLMYTSLLAAKTQKKAISITFNPDIASCSGLPSWKPAANVNWVITRN